MRRLAESRPAQAAAVNYNVRYYPLCHEIRERIARGTLGRVLSITGSYVQDWLLYPEDYNWRVEPDGRTNLRAVADIGTHWMDLAQFLTGTPIRAVNADLATFHPRRFKPVGPTDTFSGSARSRQSPASGRSRSRPRIMPRSSCGSTAVREARSTSPRSRPAARTASPSRSPAPWGRLWDSESPNRLWIGSRRGPNQILERDPALLGPAAAVDQPLSRRSRRGLSRHVQATVSRRLRLDRRGADAGRPPTFPTFADGRPGTSALRGDRPEQPTDGGSVTDRT